MKTAKPVKEPKAKAPKKPPKPNAIYRKPIKAARFDKAYVRMLGQDRDAAFLKSCFEERDGNMSLRAGLDRDSLVRLNKLAKDIKANRGAVNVVPIAALVLAAAGLAVFFLFFANPVVENLAERGLESAFQAKAEIDGLKLTLSPLGFTMRKVVVADSGAPMTNLFETGRVAMTMQLTALTRGKFNIEEAVVDSIAFGTPRASSGALPGADAPAAKAAKPEAPAEEAIDFGNFDAQALLEREKAKLGCVKAYDDASAKIEAAKTEWTARTESSKQKIESLKASTKTLLATDTKKIKTAAEALKLAEELKKTTGDAKAAAAEAGAVYDGVAKDAAAAKALTKAATDSFGKDLAYLKSFADPKSGAARGVIEPAIRSVLSDKVERYGDLGLKALDVLGRVKSASPKKEKEAKAVGPRGRDIPFASRAYPAFSIARLSSDFDAGGKRWTIDLRGVSSDPDLTGAPTKLAFSVKDAVFAVGFDGKVDLTTKGAGVYDGNVVFSGVNFDLEAALKAIGVEDFAGRLSGDLGLDGDPVDGFNAVAKLAVEEPKLEEVKGLVGEILRDSLGSRVDIDVGFGKDGLSVKTNLDKLVADGVAKTALRYAAENAKKIEAVARDWAAKELDGKLASKDLDTLLGAAKGGKTESEALKSSIDKKIAELEAKAKSFGSDALKGLPGLPGF